jgi:hypothetical protein
MKKVIVKRGRVQEAPGDGINFSPAGIAALKRQGLDPNDPKVYRALLKKQSKDSRMNTVDQAVKSVTPDDAKKSSFLDKFRKNKVTPEMIKTIEKIVKGIIFDPGVQKIMAKNITDTLPKATLDDIYDDDDENTRSMPGVKSGADTVPSKTRTDRASTTQAMREEDIIERFSKQLDEQLLEEEIDTLLEEYDLHLNEGAKQFVSSLKRKLGVPLVIGGIMAASLFGTGAQANTPTTFPSVEAAESHVEKSYGRDAKATIEKGTKSMRDLFTGDDSPIQRDQNGDIDWLASLQLDDGTIVTFTDAE